MQKMTLRLTSKVICLIENQCPISWMGDGDGAYGKKLESFGSSFSVFLANTIVPSLAVLPARKIIESWLHCIAAVENHFVERLGDPKLKEFNAGGLVALDKLLKEFGGTVNAEYPSLSAAFPTLGTLLDIVLRSGWANMAAVPFVRADAAGRLVAVDRKKMGRMLEKYREPKLLDAGKIEGHKLPKRKDIQMAIKEMQK